MSAPLPFTAFCEQVLGVTLEPAQRVFWAVAGGERQPHELDDADRELAAQIFGEVDEVPDDVRSVVALVKGADIGASYVGGLRLLYRALTADMSDASAGEVRPALVVAPNLRTARIPLRAARAAAERVPAVKALVESSGQDSIVFRRADGRFSSVECLPASVGGRATRGRRYLEVLLDEASFFRDEASGAVNDEHVFQSVVARCTGQVWLSSTPWLETNLIWRLFEQNHGHPTTALAARMPTLLVRTNQRARDMVARERERDPDVAAQEFDCEPLGAGAAAFFGAAELESALDRSLAAFPAPAPGSRATVGADLGLVRDSTAVCAVHQDRGGALVMADAIEFRPKRGTPLRLTDVVPELCRFARRHGTNIVYLDNHIISEARQHVVDGVALRAVMAGQEPKTRRHVRAKALFREGRIRIPGEFARIVAQLGDITSRPTPGGGVSITQARRRGSHGDLAQALIVALGQLGKPGRYPWHATAAARAVANDAAERSSFATMALGSFG